jgi:hypothetical protein
MSKTKYGQKILFFFCRPCGEYHLKTHPHYRAMTVDVRGKSLAYRYCWRAVSSPRVQNIRNNRLPIPGPAHAPEGSV